MATGDKPTKRITFSVKVGEEFKRLEKVGIGLFTGKPGGAGPELRGKIRRDDLKKIISFLVKCDEKGLEPTLSVFASKFSGGKSGGDDWGSKKTSGDDFEL